MDVVIQGSILTPLIPLLKCSFNKRPFMCKLRYLSDMISLDRMRLTGANKFMQEFGRCGWKPNAVRLVRIACIGS